jgi:tRNA pseudouridine13 synthase
MAQKAIAITGPLPGKKGKTADGLAGEIEKDFYESVPAQGGRRYAWVWPEAVEGLYKKETWHYELHFSLPKGSYATVFLEMLANRTLKEG